MREDRNNEQRQGLAKRAGELAAIVELSNDAIVRVRPDGTITGWNPAAERMYGYTAAEALDRSAELLEPEERTGEIRGLIRRAAAGERVVDVETVRRRKDASRVAVLVSILPVRDEHGAVCGAVSIARDLTDRRAIEAALERSEATYRHLFERHPAPMWVYDPETLRLLAVNDAAVAASGYSREELREMNVSDFLEEEERDRFRALDAGPSKASLWRLRARRGPVRNVETSAVTISFEGRAARLVLARDVTEQLRLEEELRQGQKMEALGRLAGGVAHDFNNLLVVIRGYSQVLLERLLSDDRTFVEQIDDAAARASEFTRQLLTFSRRQVLRTEPVEVNAVVQETLLLLERSLGEDVEIETSLDPRVGAILVDRSELTKTILNLAINARDAMPSGGSLRIRTALAERTFALLEVSDTGSGMDEETRRHAFDPFFTTKPDGTGLGLSSVYGLVTQSGGRLEVETAPGQGTTIQVFLPVATDAPAAAPREAPTRSPHGREIVLLVEDTDIVRTLLVHTLSSYGYHVLPAASPAEALRQAASFGGEIDLLLTDLVMPGMNGRELAEALVATRPRLRVLLTSGYAPEPELQRSIGDYEPEFIHKPFLPQELAQAVRRLLDRPRER